MPVSPNMKISDLLKTYPTLLDVLIQQSPNFARLRNPVFRRVLPKLVTVAQAATMGGLEPATLVRNLNRALGEADVEVGLVEVNTMADTPAPPWYNTAPITTTLDVREAQRRKEEPFAAIMAAVASVKLGEIFLLRNGCEPLPLYDVLGKRGFVPWARQVAPDDWEVYFFKVGNGQESTAKPTTEVGVTGSGQESNLRQTNEVHAASSGQESNVVQKTAVEASKPDGIVRSEITLTIDVRELVPPQPMMRILDALEHLAPGQTLLVHHVRRPAYLYPRLAEMGFQHETVDVAPDQVDIKIRKA